MTRFENPVHLVLFSLLAVGMTMLVGCATSAPGAANPTCPCCPGIHLYQPPGSRPTR